MFVHCSFSGHFEKISFLLVWTGAPIDTESEISDHYSNGCIWDSWAGHSSDTFQISCLTKMSVENNAGYKLYTLNYHILIPSL